MLEPDVLVRAFTGELAPGDGRTVYGIAVPYDQPAEIVEHGQHYREVFRRGAFAGVVRAAHRTKLRLGHGTDLPGLVGHARLLEERDAGLYGEFSVAEGPFGDHLLGLVHDGAVRGLSVAFSPGVLPKDNRHRAGLVERLKVRLLDHVAAVENPAYVGAAIAGVRAAGEPYPHRAQAVQLLARVTAARVTR